MAESISWVEKILQTRQWFNIAAGDNREQEELAEHVVNTELLSG